MSVCSFSSIVAEGDVASIESKRHSSTLLACSLYSAKFTPEPSNVAPIGYGRPGQSLYCGDDAFSASWTGLVFGAAVFTPAR